MLELCYTSYQQSSSRANASLGTRDFVMPKARKSVSKKVEKRPYKRSQKTKDSDLRRKLDNTVKERDQKLSKGETLDKPTKAASPALEALAQTAKQHKPKPKAQLDQLVDLLSGIDELNAK